LPTFRADAEETKAKQDSTIKVQIIKKHAPSKLFKPSQIEF